MIHEEEMKKLRAETARLRAANDKAQRELEQQLAGINRDINEMIGKMR